MLDVPQTATRILLLGGTTEASALARMLAGRHEFAAVLSLAGRTLSPKPAPIPTRMGGYGGVAGLASHSKRDGLGVMIDATHPFAAAMSQNAAAACKQAGCALIAIERPPWKPVAGDRWQRAADVASAIAALGPEPRRVFMAIGRQQIALLEAHPQHSYVIRVIDPPEMPPKLPDFKLITARGPFTVADDIALMERERIEVIVAKNSGGEAAVAKLHAARALAIPVMMVERPPVPERMTVATAQAALDWLLGYHGRTKRGE